MDRSATMLRPVQPVNVRIESRVSDLLREMGKTAFQGKNHSLAVQIWVEMLKQNVTILLGLAGALIPAGMRHLLSESDCSEMDSARASLPRRRKPACRFIARCWEIHPSESPWPSRSWLPQRRRKVRASSPDATGRRWQDCGPGPKK